MKTAQVSVSSNTESKLPIHTTHQAVRFEGKREHITAHFSAVWFIRLSPQCLYNTKGYVTRTTQVTNVKCLSQQAFLSYARA